jgi:small conductance mechanosensitive channel
MTTTPATTTPAETPVFEAVVSAEALETEARSFIEKLSAMSSQEIAINLGWTLAIIVGAIVALWLLRFAIRAIARALSPKQDKDAESGKEARRKVGGWTMIAARFLATIISAALILNLWGFDVRAGALGQVLGVFWRAGLIVMLTIGAIELVSFAITRGLHRGARHSKDLRRAAQLRTLAPLLQAVTAGLVGIIGLMMTLSQFGVEVGPLIAGAGIIGLAIGFGAQTLVKDFITGIFLILEDTVSIGDIITIGEFGGVVEDMSLRTIKLRDFDGTLHIFPYSEAMVIHNKTKSFSMAVFNLSISYTSNIVRALELMHEVGDELRSDPNFSNFILDKIEVVGVDSLADSAVMLKARIKTLPAKQWAVQREYLQRIKLAFDSNGVDIPFPHLKLVAPDTPVPVSPPRAAE